ncbi:MAG TPA: hypothetical protein VKS21_03135 [Spirochaetota bacterium]|nr:hypothetical protein [Spirochaetota bacterium]
MKTVKLILRLLRHINYRQLVIDVFTKNIFTKMFSVIGAFTIFFYIERQSEIDKVIDVPLTTTDVPEMLNVSSPLPETVVAFLKGNKGDMALLNMNNVKAVVPLTGALVGTKKYYVRLHGLPEGIQVLRILPAKISIQLSKVTMRWIKVKPNLDESGFPDNLIAETKIDPPSLKMYGPKDIFKDMTSVRTEPISIGNLRRDKEIEVELDAVYKSNPKLKFNKDKKFTVNIFINEKKNETEVSQTGKNYNIKINLKSGEEQPFTVKDFDSLYVTNVVYDVPEVQQDLFDPNMDLQFFIDITRINRTGVFNLKVKYENLPEYVELLNYSPKTIRVKIIKK